MARARPPTTGQFSLDGNVYGLDKLVNAPQVIEDNGMRVIHLVVSQEDNKISGFTAEALRQARNLSPEVQSDGKPPWLSAEWQAKRRMRKYGAR